VTSPREYLVQYGRSAFVGRFAAPPEFRATRGDAVLARTPRGLELGEVLDSGESKFVSQLDSATGGQIVRSIDETERIDVQSLEGELIDAANEWLGDMPLSIVDAEILFDRSAAILHVLAWGACNADSLCERLTTQFKMPVRILDLAQIPISADPVEEPASSGCGKDGCGSEGGGCSSCGTGGGCGTKSCSSGSVKSADELTAYFADLREKMEEQGKQRTPLH